MSDILSALSLLLAVLGLLYSAWYSELSSATKENIPKFKEDRKPVLERIQSVYYSKSLPLSASALIISIIILPDFIKIIIETIGTFQEYGIYSVKYYDSVKSLFFATFILLIVFTFHLIILSKKINKVIKDCKK